LIHLGMVFVGTPYGQNPQILVTDGIGGSPYGPGTLAGTDGSRQPVEADHNRTQPRQSPCSRRELSQKPQGKLGGTITIGT
jgi:multimeric flavodoxin WrbA